MLNKSRVVAAHKTPFVKTKEGKKSLDQFRGMKDSKELQEKFTKAVKGHFELLDDSFLNQNEESVLKAEKLYGAQKNIGEFKPQLINTYSSFRNEFQIDTGWMDFFDFVDISGSAEAKIADFKAYNPWQQMKRGEPIEPNALGEENFYKFSEQRHGAGYFIDQRWLETNQSYNVNTVFQAIGDGRLTYMANAGYAMLANSTNVTVVNAASTSISDIIEAINTGVETLIDANSGEGYALSESTQIRALAHGTYKGILGQVVRALPGDNGTNPMIEWNVSFQHTFNSFFPKLNGGKKYLTLNLPGFRNKFGNFKGLRTASEYKFTVDGTNIEAQEYWAINRNNDQKVIVTLEP